MDVEEILRDVGVDPRYVAILDDTVVALNPRRAGLTVSRREELRREGIKVVRSKVVERASSRFHQVVTDYDLFEPREEVVVGFSGGKDSVTCLLMLEPLTRRLGLRIRPVLVETRLHGDPIWGREGREVCEEICRSLGFQLEYVEPREDVGELAEEHGESPCLICSLIRRRELRERGDKLVLAHTLDDAIVTAMASAIKGEGLNILRPVEELGGMRSEYVDYDFPETTIVRPMIRVPEVWTRLIPGEVGLPIFESDCPYSKPYGTTLRGKVAHGLEWLRLEVGADSVEFLDRLYRSFMKTLEATRG
ncbi:tRNA 2-thiocytidine biosynthesis TtcA family protein [Methanopyrus kandleri]|uniref:Predicted ATPase of the PP-loop superfamily implicated in cell cycle control n=2 Tax=Methanopyrus kandleri TaxID=2320 RepID=Q8TZ87_METKA|nr:tRNA 2-thiocytidine biosynthesis TtcA family protein [Methanopyrus kandleri]AAM01268.1 Predicted ATPase of the PP-loop superfamily implicated in cell cycle control [Methanopyrus kandleri AV19]HII70810.1 tRNA 2-thiocytidine biosynthesis protein TtcA [Methanopyrus kandleri]